MKSFRFFGRDLKIRRIPNFPMPFTNLNNGNYRNNSTNCTPLKFIAIELIHTEKKNRNKAHDCTLASNRRQYLAEKITHQKRNSTGVCESMTKNRALSIINRFAKIIMQKFEVTAAPTWISSKTTYIALRKVNIETRTCSRLVIPAGRLHYLFESS